MKNAKRRQQHVDDARPRVTVVVPARDAVATLARAVSSAVAQHPVPDEVLVAVGDEATAKLARALAEEHPSVRVVDNPVGTTPAALNLAVRTSSGDVIVRLDAHAELPTGYIDTALADLEATDAGNVGGMQVPSADGGFAAAVAAAMRSPLGSGGAAYRSGTSAGPAETVYLGVFRRDAIEGVGGFDERLERNQDYELNHRLRKAGWAVWFDPRLQVTYRPRNSVGALARQYFGYGRFKRLVAGEHPDSLRLRQLAPVGMVLGVGVSVGLGAFTTWWVPAGALGAYGAALLAGGVVADRRRPLSVAAALATMHWSWGVGFLVGPPRRVRTAPRRTRADADGRT